MRPRDARVWLADAITAGQLAQEFIAGSTFEVYSSDRLLSSAVERQLELLGEALNRVAHADDSFTEVLPDVSRIVGFRNILAHGYDRVSDALVWSIATEQLPGLLARLRELV